MTTPFDSPAPARHRIPENARSLLVIIHGMAEYAGRYDQVIEFFNRQQIGCVTFDLRGHGSAPRSERERGDVDSFDTFVTHATAVLEATRAAHPALPVFMWGHSMGALVATLTAARIARQGPRKVRGVITSGIPIAAFDAYPRLARRLLVWFARIAPTFRMARPFRPERLSRNLEIGMRYGGDPLVPKAITLRLLAGISLACERCLKVAPRLLMPWLALHGTEDEIAPAIGSQRLIDALGGTDKQLRLWPGARHEVHNEIEPTRTEFLMCIVDWIRERSVESRSSTI